MLVPAVVLVPVLVVVDVEACAVVGCVGSVGAGAAKVCGLTKTLKARTPPTAIRAVSEIIDSLCMWLPIPTSDNKTTRLKSAAAGFQRV